VIANSRSFLSFLCVTICCVITAAGGSKKGGIISTPEILFCSRSVRRGGGGTHSEMLASPGSWARRAVACSSSCWGTRSGASWFWAWYMLWACICVPCCCLLLPTLSTSAEHRQAPSIWDKLCSAAWGDCVFDIWRSGGSPNRV